MVGLMSHSFPRIEGCLPCRCGSHSKIADTNIHPNNLLVTLKDWVSSLSLERNEQIEVFLGLVIPEFGIPYACSVLDQGEMGSVSLIGERDAPFKGTQAHLLLTFEGIIPLIGVLHGW